jgi:hypothetical protein
VFFYVMKNLAWRPVLVADTFPRTNLSNRILSMIGVRANLAWRYLNDEQNPDGEQEPDDWTPPYHDPCFGGVPIEPIDPGEVIPLTSRFFGMSNSPLGMLDADNLFTGTQKALGPWYQEDLPYVASHGATLVGGPGGGSRIKAPGNYWDLDTFVNGWQAIIDPLYGLLLTHTGLGSFFGQSWPMTWIPQRCGSRTGFLMVN